MNDRPCAKEEKEYKEAERAKREACDRTHKILWDFVSDIAHKDFDLQEWEQAVEACNQASERYYEASRALIKCLARNRPRM
jgi:hypothetical protein